MNIADFMLILLPTLLLGLQIIFACFCLQLLLLGFPGETYLAHVKVVLIFSNCITFIGVTAVTKIL